MLLDTLFQHCKEIQLHIGGTISPTQRVILCKRRAMEQEKFNFPSRSLLSVRFGTRLSPNFRDRVLSLFHRCRSHGSLLRVLRFMDFLPVRVVQSVPRVNIRYLNLFSLAFPVLTCKMERLAHPSNTRNSVIPIHTV